MSTLKPTHVLLAALFLFGVYIRIADLSLSRRISADESVYKAQAINMVSLGPVAGNRATCEKYLRNPELAKYPPPTRIGYVLPVALTMWVTGSRSEGPGAWVSCLASLLALLLAIRVGSEYFGEWPTILGLSFLCVFPADLLIASRCWSDSLVGLMGLAMVYLTLKAFSKGPANLVYSALLVATGSLALLVKETCVLIYGPCLALAVGKILFKKSSRTSALLIVGLATLGVAADFALWAAFTGGFRLFFDLVYATQRANAGTINPYAELQSGPPYRILWAFWIFSPLTSGLALLGLMVSLVPGSWFPFSRSPELRSLSLAAIAFSSLFAIIPHWMSLRYLSPFYPAFCLFAGFALYLIGSTLGRQMSRSYVRAVAITCGSIVVMFSLASDRYRFKRYIRAGMADSAVGVIAAYERSFNASPIH